jgi:cysteine desulfurase/selenocysteine lyase
VRGPSSARPGAKSILDANDRLSASCNFIAFSIHVMLAPTGIALVNSRAPLDDMEPTVLGRGMVDFVREDDRTWCELPWCFERGTRNVAGTIDWAGAVLVEQLGIDRDRAHEDQSMALLLELLDAHPRTKVSEAGHSVGGRRRIISFTVDGVRSHDTAAVLAGWCVAARAWNDCREPPMRRFGLHSTVRVSPAPESDGELGEGTARIEESP